MTRESAEASASGTPPQPAKAREIATRIGRTLIAAGHEAYFAGGCVRDRLLGIEPEDYDIATSAKPEEISKLFRSAYGVGESFGVMLVRMHGIITQVATFRTDGVYSDGRHPDEVTFSDAQHDAQRRDFTINALFEHPVTGAIVDYAGGQEDLKARMIRAVGNPHARLREDNLRMLRAVRFAARFGFTIEEETAAAIQEAAGALRGVSRERIGQEIRRMCIDANRAVAAWEMQYLGLDEPVLQESRKTVAPTRLGRLPESAELPTCLAAWLLDRHERVEYEPRQPGSQPNGHGPEDLTDEPMHEIVRRWTNSLVLSNSESGDLLHTLEIYQTLRQDWWSLGVAKQKRLASQPQFGQALLILQAVDRQGFIDVRRQTVKLAESELKPEPLIDGEDLKRLGIEPGPVYRRVLEAVYDAQLEGSVRDKEAALRLARFVAEAEER